MIDTGLAGFSATLRRLAIFAITAALSACATDRPSPSPAAPAAQPSAGEPWLVRRERIIAEMQERAAHCAKLNGYVDERTARDNTPAQERVTLYQMPDGYDCFGGGTRTIDSTGSIRQRVPLVINPRTRR